MSRWRTALALAAAISAVAGCGEEDSATGARAPVAVEVVKAERRTLDRVIDAVGIVEPSESVWISSGIPGVVQSINFTDGQRLDFAPGQAPILFRLDTHIMNIEVEGAVREASAAGSDLAEAQARFDRVKMLYEGKAASKAEFDEAKFALDRTRAARSRAQGAVAGEKRKVGQATIRAPFPGTIGERLVSPGEYVSPGQRLVELVKDDELKVAFSVSSAYSALLKNGLPVAVTIPAVGPEPRTSELSYVAPRIDEAGTVHLHARLPNPDRAVRPGLVAQVQIVLASGVPAVVVPEEALEHRGDQVLVYVVDGDKAVARQVKVERRLRGEIALASGLEGGEPVIARGLERIADGAVVRVVRRPAEVAPAAKAGARAGNGGAGRRGAE